MAELSVRGPRWTAGLLVPVALGLLAGCTGSGREEAIRSYEVDVRATADGSLTVQETIDYDFADEERHGILRLVPDRAPYEQTRDRRYPISDITVQSPTGAPAQAEVTAEEGVTTIQVGDPGTVVGGRHTYVLSYRVAGVADPGDDADRLTWNAVGTDWEVPIDRVAVRLAGPAGAVPSRGVCVVGEPDDRAPCPADVGAGGELRASAGGLAAGEGVTVGATFPAGTFPGAAAVLEDTFSPAHAFRLTTATAGAAVGSLLLVALPAVLRARRGRPRAGLDATGEAPQLTPPLDARPALLGTVLDGRAQRHEVTATLLDLAVRGQLRIEEVADPATERGDGDRPVDWRVHRVDGTDRRGLRRYEEQLLDAVFATGDRVLLSDLQSGFAAVEADVCRSLHTDVVELGWFVADPAATRRRWYGLGTALLIGGVLLTVALALTSTWALAGTGVALAGLVVLGMAGRMPLRTAAGEELRRQTQSFRTSLDRTDPAELLGGRRGADLAGAARTDLGLRYLPYAVALGIAEEWQEALRRSGADGVPDWYTPSSPGSTVAVWPALVAFSSPDNPALTPPAAADGTGSASVGGGAGGGGGGSW
jgi:hypothetical protein